MTWIIPGLSSTRRMLEGLSFMRADVVTGVYGPTRCADPRSFGRSPAILSPRAGSHASTYRVATPPIETEDALLEVAQVAYRLAR
ncbi:MAG: hypothetical protein K8R60_02915 [Burkholderiales bacterium]|nr:hypothetical protein [Burkholderiales bacterium]